MKGYKQAVDSLSASISAARESEGQLKTNLNKAIEKAAQGLRAVISTAETTREWAPLAAYLETLVADEVLRESCGDAIESAKKLIATLQAEEKEQMTMVSDHVCRLIMFLLIDSILCS